MPGSHTFKILSLDGGGSWALIQAKALLKIYGDAPGHSVLSKFDLVIANSGGSLLVAALLAGRSISDALKLFTDEQTRRRIFVELPWYKKKIVGAILGVQPRYSASEKIDGIRSVLGAVGDSDLTTMPSVVTSSGANAPQFLITAFDYDRRRAVYFRSDANSLSGNLTSQGPVSLAQAVHASSNAPVNYFDAPAEFNNHSYWDGGIAGLNNPVMAGVVEAMANKVQSSDIQVFSIGTGSVWRPLDGPAADPILLQPRVDSSITTDIHVLATSILDDPPDAATFHAHVALGQPLPAKPADCPIINGSVIRLNPLVQPVYQNGKWELPAGLNVDQFSKLAELDMDAVEQDQVDLIETFCDAWIVDNVVNQPIRASRTLDCEVGQPRFSDGLTLWRQRAP